MRHNFSIRIEQNDEVFVLDFHTTRTKVDKLFFALSFLIPDGDISRVTLSIRHDSSKVAFNSLYELVNEAVKRCV